MKLSGYNIIPFFVAVAVSLCASPRLHLDQLLNMETGSDSVRETYANPQPLPTVMNLNERLGLALANAAVQEIQYDHRKRYNLSLNSAELFHALSEIAGLMYAMAQSPEKAEPEDVVANKALGFAVLNRGLLQLHLVTRPDSLPLITVADVIGMGSPTVPNYSVVFPIQATSDQIALLTASIQQSVFGQEDALAVFSGSDWAGGRNTGVDTTLTASMADVRGPLKSREIVENPVDTGDKGCKAIISTDEALVNVSRPSSLRIPCLLEARVIR
jgi:hypothetical protein